MTLRVFKSFGLDRLPLSIILNGFIITIPKVTNGVADCAWFYGIPSLVEQYFHVKSLSIKVKGPSLLLTLKNQIDYCIYPIS